MKVALYHIIQEKVAENKCKLGEYLTDSLRTRESSKRESSSGNMLSYRMNNPLAVLKPQLTFNLDSPNISEVTIYQTAMLPLVEKIMTNIQRRLSSIRSHSLAEEGKWPTICWCYIGFLQCLQIVLFMISREYLI